jgi:ribosomal protein S18 acetylase RimI-like enzyme
MPRYDPQHLRPYRATDLNAVLAAVGGWNARSDGCGYLHPGDVCHIMSNALRGRNLDRHFMLYEDPAGEILAVLTLYSALDAAFDLMVHPDCRGGDLEPVLLTEGADRVKVLLREAGSEEASLGTDAMDCDTVRRDLLSQQGYSASAHPPMLYTTRSLGEPIPAPAVPPGFTLRSVAGEHEVEAVCAVHDGSFTPKWTAEEYLAVMRTPGFAIDRELVVVAPDGRFAAFLVYWIDPVSRSGLFEPVGCHRGFQRRGLAAALMYEGMRRMVARGMERAIVNHNADNPAAVALYRSVGFRLRYTIVEHRKPSL